MKVLFYSNKCKFSKQMLQLIDEYGIIDDFKLVNFDEEKNTNILGNKVKVVPTIIDSDHKEILEGKKAFEYLHNKKYFNYPTNNILSWKEKEVPNPKIKDDKLAVTSELTKPILSNKNFDSENPSEKTSIETSSQDFGFIKSNDDQTLLSNNEQNKAKESNNLKKDGQVYKKLIKNGKLNKNSSLLLRRR